MAEVKAKEQVKEAPAQERELRQLNPSRMKGAEYERDIHVVTPDEGTQPEDMLDPAYWAHVASKLRPWNRIEARANDGSWYAECLVLDASRNWAKIKILNVWNLTTADVSQTQSEVLIAYEVRHRGPHNKWSVIRMADSACIHEFEDTELGARTWLTNHLKAMK